jgi:hypothetical protein
VVILLTLALARVLKSRVRRLAISFFKLAEYALALSLALVGSRSDVPEGVTGWVEMIDIRLVLGMGSTFERRMEMVLGREGLDESAL